MTKVCAETNFGLKASSLMVVQLPEVTQVKEVESEFKRSVLEAVPLKLQGCFFF